MVPPESERERAVARLDGGEASGAGLQIVV